jgi:hypothetical protein
MRFSNFPHWFQLAFGALIVFGIVGGVTLGLIRVALEAILEKSPY